MKKFLNSKTRPEKAALFCGVGLFVLVFLRSVMVSLTHDECITYFMFVKQDWAEFFDGGPLQTNNHPVNTILAKFAYYIFGNQPWALRLPNVLFFIPYLVYGYRILNRFFKNKVLIIPFFLGISSVPYLLDFFSICRGYGIALGCTMPAVYFMLCYLNDKNSRKSLWSGIAFIFISLLGNFTMLYFALPVFIFVILSLFTPFLKTEMKEKNVAFVLNQLWPWVLLLLFCYLYGSFIVSTGSLEAFATKENFWHAQIAPMIYNLFHGTTHVSEIFAFSFVLFGGAVIGLCLFWSIFALFKKTPAFFEGTFLFIVLTFYSFGVIYANNNADIPFAPTRAVAFLVPLFYLMIAFLADYLYSKVKLLSYACSFAFVFFTVSGFCFSFQFSINMTWPENSRIREMLILMAKDGKEKLVATTFLYNPPIRYYTERLGLSKVKTVVVQAPDTVEKCFNYLLIQDQSNLPVSIKGLRLPGWENTLSGFYENKNFDALKARYYTVEKQFWNRAQNNDIGIPPVPFSQGNLNSAFRIYHLHDYSEMSYFAIDSLAAQSKGIHVNYKATILSGNDSPGGTLVVERLRKGQSYFWDGPSLNSYEIKKNKWREIEVNYLFTKDWVPGDSIRAFFYYTDKDSLWINDTKLSVRIYDK